MGVKYISIDLLLIESLLKEMIDFQDFERKAQKMNDICGMRSDRYAELLHIGKLIQEMKK